MDNYVLPIMLYSDSIQLANFGSASLWPMYMFLGGKSNARNKSSQSTCHHIAYIPSVSLPLTLCSEPALLTQFQLPASVQGVIRGKHGRSGSAAVLTLLRRELMHAILDLILFQPEFLDAYADGFVFRCNDNIERRLFPRILVYSADYPERCVSFSFNKNSFD
jgi:hypothetical protein